MKKRGLLVVLLALVVATAGVVYAHWTDTLQVNAQVNTGSIDMAWMGFGTDDDGIVDNDLSGNDNNGPIQLYDAWATASSADPREAYSSTGYPTGTLDRYDKDVGICTALASGDTLTITIDNAYPSYHCTVFGTFKNRGTVPVKYAGFSMEFRKNGALYTPWYGMYAELNSDWSMPGGCYDAGQIPPEGFADQIDPGATGPFFITFHLWPGQGDGLGQVDPGDSYQIIIKQDFVNWNEWDDSFCHMTVNGEVIY